MLLDLWSLFEEVVEKTIRVLRLPIDTVRRRKATAAFTITASGRALEVITSGQTEIVVGATSQAEMSARAEIPLEWVEARYRERLERDFEEILLLLLD